MSVENYGIEPLESQRSTAHVGGCGNYLPPGVDKLRHLALEVFSEAAFSTSARLVFVCPALIAAAPNNGRGSQAAASERGAG